MASGKFDLTKTLGVSSYIYSRCEWSGSGNVDSNKTPIYVKVIVGKRAGSNTATTCTFNTNVSVAGAEYPSNQSSSPYTSVSANQEIVVFEGTFTVPHENDGSKSTTISVSIGNNGVYHAEGSSVITLDTIPRATELPNLSTLTVEHYNVFSISPKIKGANHSIKFRFGNTKAEATSNPPVTKWLQSDGSLGDNEMLLSGETFQVLLPTYLYDVFDGNMGHIAMTLRTYNSSEYIDEKTDWVKLLPGTNCTPVVSAVINDTNPKTISATGAANNIVANASILEIIPSIQISDPDDTNSWIVSKSVDGVAFTEETKFEDKPNKKEFLVSVTNNRGLTGNYTATVTGRYIPYVDLTFDIEDIARTEPTSAEVVIKYSGKYYAGEFTDNLGDEGIFNQLMITWGYKIKGSEGDFITGGVLTPTIDAEKNTYSGEESLGELFDYKTNYEFKFDYIDRINQYTKTEVYVTKGEPIFWWNEDSVHVLGTLYADNIYGMSGGNLLEFSTEEHIVGKWIDGKPLYRKVISTYEPVITDVNLAIAHGVLAWDKMWVDLGNSYYYEANRKRSLPLEQTFYTSTTGSDMTHVYIEGDYIYIVSHGGWGEAWEKVITLLYTKSNDPVETNIVEEE